MQVKPSEKRLVIFVGKMNVFKIKIAFEAFEFGFSLVAFNVGGPENISYRGN